MAPSIAVVGSVNLDLVARVERLPRAGETLSGASFDRFAGGKGANQAVAAARLGATVRFVGSVGRDAFADEALAGLREADVELDVATPDAPTGVALILVDGTGETVIVIAAGANGVPRSVDVATADAVICQLEVPDDVVVDAARQARFFCLNAAPARPVDVQPDLLVVNRLEHEIVTQGKLVAVTMGPEGAVLLEDGREIASATPPRIGAVDGTAAGDAFTACLVVSLLEGRERQEALVRACAAGALAASRQGAQPSLPTVDEVDAILRA